LRRTWHGLGGVLVRIACIARETNRGHGARGAIGIQPAAQDDTEDARAHGTTALAATMHFPPYSPGSVLTGSEMYEGGILKLKFGLDNTQDGSRPRGWAKMEIGLTARWNSVDLALVYAAVFAITCFLLSPFGDHTLYAEGLTLLLPFALVSDAGYIPALGRTAMGGLENWCFSRTTHQTWPNVLFFPWGLDACQRGGGCTSFLSRFYTQWTLFHEHFWPLSQH